MAGMEAALASGILRIVINKLGPLVMKEYSSIVGAKNDLQDLHGQIVEMNKWLERVGANAMGNDPSFNWLKQLKDIAYDIDDIVDDFQLKAEKHDTVGDCGIVPKYLCTKPKSVMFQCKAASKIKAIKKKFASIVKQRNDFSAITNSLPVDHLVRHMNMTTGEMPLLPNIDAASVLGRHEVKHELISKLVEARDQEIINIVSIIGLGGSGKTTLAKLIFNDDDIVKKHFAVKIWVHVSQEFDVAKLVEKLFEAISGEKSEKYPLQQMAKKISDNLTRERYLLVLDDVWTKDQIQWDQFMVHLKGGTPRSAILLTTRSREVAGIVRSTDQFDLPFLSLDDSWQLFQENIAMSPQGWEFEFVKVGKQIVKKCGGVPLAIKALAGALRGKERIEEWKAMRDNNLLHDNGEEHGSIVFACLRLSYLHLPSHLKKCFTICSLFPKGHNIDKEQLIDQWIAHDMITPETGVSDLEYIGHKYFHSLEQMFFLQDVEEKDGRVRCRMHDLVHDLGRFILGDEISSVVPMEAPKSTKRHIYFSLTDPERTLSPKNIFEKTRTVYVAASDDSVFGKELKNARHLRSVVVEHTFLTSVTTTILQIKNLRYLSIYKSEKLLALPESISDLWSLQALHVTHCPCFHKLPGSIGKLQKLRTLNLSFCRLIKSLPDSIGDCHLISSIDLSGCRDLILLPNSVGRNEKLRVLRLRSTDIERLPSSITTLRNLECLDLQHCLYMVELPEGISNLQKLTVLNLKGCFGLRRMPVGIGKLSRLQKLGTFVVGEGETFPGRISELANVPRIGEELSIRRISHGMDPKDAHRACLKQMTNLQKLGLQWRANAAGEVSTELKQAVLDGLEPPPGIEELKIDGYSGTQYARWMQNEVGGRVKESPKFLFLRVMKLCDFPKLKHLHGLVELPCLEELSLQTMPSLESISGGPFPSLVKLNMHKLPSLGEVWIIEETTMPCGDGGGCSNRTPHLGKIIRIGSCISDLSISSCPRLKVNPYLPLSLQHVSAISEQLLQSPWECQLSSLFSGLSHLKELRLSGITGSGLGLLELLQYSTALESLDIENFDVLTELPESLWSLTSLQSLTVSSFPAIHVLPELLGELRDLRRLGINFCSSLSILPQSMGHLTALQVLYICGCPKLVQLPDCLGELRALRSLSIVRSRSVTCLPKSICSLSCLQSLRFIYSPGIASFPEEIQGLTALKELQIKSCPNMSSFPQSIGRLTSLQLLQIYGAYKLHQLPESVGELRSLCKLKISDLPGETCLPQSVCRLTSLGKLSVIDCPHIKSLPESINGLSALSILQIYGCTELSCLPQTFGCLTSLERLEIVRCPALHQLPKCLGELRSLHTLTILDLPSLTCLPQSMGCLTSLRWLRIRNCTGIKSMPKGIKGLTSLLQLCIQDCPDLKRRCERGKGKDWHLVSHIPELDISQSTAC